MRVQVAPYGHADLSVACVEVSNVAELKDVANAMIAYCKAHPHAVGLSGPQVGRPERFFVMRVDGSDNFVAVANPVLEAARGESTPFLEGCLSLPGFEATIFRPTDITVRYVDIFTGKETSHDLKGVFARVFQHELDHLNGIQIVDLASRNDCRRGKDAITAAQKRAKKFKRS